MTSSTERHTKEERRDALQLLAAAAGPERAEVRVGALCLVAAAALEASGPLLGRHVIDSYLIPHRVTPFVALLVLATFVVGAAAGVIRYFQLVRLAEVAMRSVTRLREQVYGHVIRLPIAFFDAAIIGKLVSRVTNDTEQVKNLYVQILFVMLDSAITVIGAIAAMALLDVRLMAVVALLVPASVLIIWLYQRLSALPIARARELRSEINAQVAESIAGMPVLQAAAAQSRFNQRFVNTNHQHYRSRLGELRVNAWLLRPMLDLFNVILLAVVIFAFGRQSLGGVAVGVLYAFVSYIGRVVDPLIQITMQFGQAQQAIVAAARVNALLEETVVPASDNLLSVGRGSVAIAHLTFGYDANRPVLHDINLHIPAGQFIGIVGHTGSGKSTLLALLLRFYQAQSGHIDIDGVPLEQIGHSAYRRHVGLVPQDPFLLAASARENIAMGRALTQAQIERAARAAHCHDVIVRLEQGYDTPLGEGGARLSVGEKQLVAIARALAGQPRILLLDEATSHIDSQTEKIIQQTLAELRHSVTIIAIAHRLSTIRDADQIVVLNHGRVAETGTHAVLIERADGIYQRLYRLQQLGAEETD